MNEVKLTRRASLKVAAAASVVACAGLRAQGKAQEPQEIRIGQSIHLSGPYATSIKAALKGQDLAIEELNRKGGVAGRPVRLIALDDAFDPKRSVENVQTLIDRDKVVALTGLASAASVTASLPTLLDRKVPLIGIYSGSPTLREKQHPYLFTTTASYREEVRQIVRTLVSQQKSRIAVVFQNPVLLPFTEEAIQKYGASLVAKGALDGQGENSTQVCQALAAAKPDAVLFMTFGPSIVSFVRAARANLGVPIYALSVANSMTMLSELGENARGLAFTSVVPYPWRQTSQLTKDFTSVMARANIPIDYDHMLGYLNLRVLIEAIRRAGKSTSPQAIVKAMESMEHVDLGGYPLSYGPDNHHGSNFVEITIVGPGGRYIR